MAAVSAHLGEQVVVHGTVAVVGWTAAHNAVNLELAAADGKGLLCWISPKVLRRMVDQFGPGFPDDLVGRGVTLTGPLSAYGGRRPDWQGRSQMALTEPAQIVPDARRP